MKKTVGIVPNITNERSMQAANELKEWLEKQGIQVVVASFLTEELTDYSGPIKEFENCSFVVALGGDGTTLKAARHIGYSQIPLLSLNFGTLGFLSTGPADDMFTTVQAALSEAIPCVPRTTLSIELHYEGGVHSTFFALNEVAVARGHIGRIIDYTLFVNGISMASMRGDGMIISTATGSTAYALSAGGPIVAPGHSGMIAVPLAPHTLQSRAMVTGPQDVIEVSIDSCADKTIDVFIDGVQVAGPQPKRIVARKGYGDILLMQLGESGFYQTTARVFYK